jgi:Tfp pilus assembly protein PilO
MSARTKLILSVLGVFVLCLGTYFFLVKPSQGQLKQVRIDIEDEENKTVQLQAELGRLQQLQANAPALEAELTAFRRYVPEDNEVANVIFLVEQAASQAGVGFVEITPELPKPPPEGAPLAEVRTTIGAKGDYFAMQDFTRRLYELERAMRIDIMTLAAEEDTGTTDTATAPSADQQLRLDITARVFYEPPKDAINAAGSTTSPTTATP